MNAQISIPAKRSMSAEIMMSHINSYGRKSLAGATPYKVASAMLPKEFFDILGIELVPPD